MDPRRLRSPSQRDAPLIRSMERSLFVVVDTVSFYERLRTAAQERRFASQSQVLEQFIRHHRYGRRTLDEASYWRVHDDLGRYLCAILDGVVIA